MGKTLKKSAPEVMSCAHLIPGAGLPSVGMQSILKYQTQSLSVFVKRQSPPEGDLLDGTACAQAELQKQESSSLFAGAGQHVLCLLSKVYCLFFLFIEIMLHNCKDHLVHLGKGFRV